jgi:hypothetical protein
MTQEDIMRKIEESRNSAIAVVFNTPLPNEMSLPEHAAATLPDCIIKVCLKRGMSTSTVDVSEVIGSTTK